MIFKNSKIQKTIVGLIIFSMLLPSFTILTIPKKTTAQAAVVNDPPHTAVSIWDKIVNAITASQTTTDTAISIKNVAKEVGRQLLMVIARRALQALTRSTVNWINNGFHGNPLFLENPQSFFKDIAKYEIKNLVNLFGYDNLKYPFR